MYYLWNFLIYIGLPAVALYHHIHDNIFLNVAAKDAKGLEKVSNTLLAPTSYILGGKEAIPLPAGSPFAYEIKQRYDYTDGHMTRNMCLAAILTPVSITLGVSAKALSFFSLDTRERYQKITQVTNHPVVISNVEYYQSEGVNFQDYENLDTLESQGHARRKGEEDFMPHLKEGLTAIYEIFKKHNIPCWVDCGTCLGALRHGGVIPWDEDIDMAIIANDHDNAMRALKELDPDKFVAQDWSGRALPKTYIRIYVKEAHNHIDLYHFKIDGKTRIACQVLSNEFSKYMPEWWKIRERKYKVPTSFDTIFPLRKANFDGIEVYVPNLAMEYLQLRYGENIDPVMLYNELTDEYEKDEDHPYWKGAFVK